MSMRCYPAGSQRIMLEAHPAARGTFPAFTVHVDRLEDLPAQLAPDTPRFVLLVAADTQALDGAALVGWAHEVLECGATYVCCWGPGCARLEDCFDEAALARDNFEAGERVIMTTSHADERLTDAVWFALRSALPHEGWAEGTGTTVFATVGSRVWSDELRSCLTGGAPLPDEA